MKIDYKYFVLGLVGLTLNACAPETQRSAQCAMDEIATQSGCVPMGGGDGGVNFLPTPELPMAVDDWYAASGYMKDGEDPMARYLSGDSSCPERAHANAVGQCHRFTYQPGPLAQAGVYWQYPANNWGDTNEPGLAVPSGAQSVRFYAWSDTDALPVTFMAGLGNEIDGFGIELNSIMLTTDPTEYTIDLTGVTYDEVIGAFGWFHDSTGNPVAINIDDIHWSEAPPLEAFIAPEIELPFTLQTYFSPSGYMGDGEDPEGRYLLPFEACLSEGGDIIPLCTKFTYKPGGPESQGGVYWQYPADNWGTQGEECTEQTLVCDAEGFEIPQGAQSIQFIAWTNLDTYALDFIAGISDVDGFSVSRTVTLTSEAQLFSLDLTGITYDKVVGGFAWFGAAATSDLEIYIQEITYSQAAPLPVEEMETSPTVEQIDAPFELPYPLLAAFGPSGVMPASAAEMVSVTPCTDEIALEMNGCVAFTVAPGASPWAGVYYHTMDNGWTGPAATLPSGANALTFYAWSDSPGVMRKFGVGDSGAGDPFGLDLIGVEGANAQNEFALPMMPTLYRIEFPSSPESLVGGLFWAGPVATETTTFYLAEAQFVE